MSIYVDKESDDIYYGSMPTVSEYDDHIYHISKHNEYFKNKHLTTDQRIRYMTHIQEHEQMLLQSNQSAVTAVPTQFNIGDKVKYRTSNEWGIITNHYRTPIQFYFTVKWDSSGLTQDFDADSIDQYVQLVGNPPDPNIIPGKDLIFNNSTVTLPRKEHRFDNSYQRDYECKPISCCSDHKNQEIYTNFYDKRVKYCKKCGNEIK